MHIRSAWTSILLLVSFLPAAAQTAVENYQKAMDAYREARYVDSRALLLSAERQLGGPKLKTTTLLILATYKTNSFDSADLLRRISVYRSLSVEGDEMKAEIQRIERTVRSWRSQLDAKIERIVKSRDLASARSEAKVNYKTADYNQEFRVLYTELSAVKDFLGRASLSKSDSKIVAAAQRVAAGSRFGFEEDAKQHLRLLDSAFSKKVAALNYPDEWVAEYHRLFGSGLNGIAVDSGRSARLAAENERNIARRQSLLDRAAAREAEASSAAGLGALGVLGTVGCGVVAAIGLITAADDLSLGFLSLAMLGGGSYGGYKCFEYAAKKVRSAESLRGSARDYRIRASKISMSLAPAFDFDSELGLKPGISVALSFNY